MVDKENNIINLLQEKLQKDIWVEKALSESYKNKLFKLLLEINTGIIRLHSLFFKYSSNKGSKLFTDDPMLEWQSSAFRRIQLFTMLPFINVNCGIRSSLVDYGQFQKDFVLKSIDDLEVSYQKFLNMLIPILKRVSDISDFFVKSDISKSLIRKKANLVSNNVRRRFEPLLQMYDKSYDRSEKEQNYHKKKCFNIAFVGTVKAGKSTLINAVLKKNLASSEVTPETAALTEFVRADSNYVRVCFYSSEEWQEVWKSISELSSDDPFFCEYSKDQIYKKSREYIGKTSSSFPVKTDSELENLILSWTSSKFISHLFIKKIIIGVQNGLEFLPENVAIVDTPGLFDPLVYRSNLTRKYIKEADAVVICIPQHCMREEEVNTIRSVFSSIDRKRSDIDKLVYVVVTGMDRFNNPERDFRRQKKYFSNFLESLDCFGSRKVALNNIISVSAFIYNSLLRLKNNLLNDPNYIYSVEAYSLLSFAGRTGLAPEDITKWSDEYISSVMMKTNVSRVVSLLKNIVYSQYKTLYEEMNVLYSEIENMELLPEFKEE